MHPVSPDRPSVAFRRVSITVSQATIFLVVTHVAGVIGYLLPTSRPLFQWVTPFHLLLTTALLLCFHRDWRTSFVAFAIGTMLFGYGVEVVGVQTSAIFGAYAYDTTLGFKVLGVPLVIGLNWLLMTYLCGSVCHLLPVRRIYQTGLAALLMVVVDWLIEPVAIAYDFWHWQTPDPPLHNYLGWFGIALLMQLAFFYLPFSKKNLLALPLLSIQILFYISLQLL